jgi:hypothetical protein
VLGQVFEWSALHQQELLADWALVTAQQLPGADSAAGAGWLDDYPLCDISAVEIRGHYRLRLTFSEGLVGDVDLSHLVGREGVFTSLYDPMFFAQVRVDLGIATITWPGRADLAPELL